ncbi:MAG: hypothetical protein ABIO24_10580, partial [Saprospiraceae bacterium]
PPFVGLTLGLFLAFSNPGLAQEPAVYQGVRLAVFELKIQKESSTAVTLKCSVANTGRLVVDMNGKDRPVYPPLILELDSLHLPAAFRVSSLSLRHALLREKFRLLPGEIRSGLTLSVAIADTLPEMEALPVCTNLVIDTAYFLQQNERSLIVIFSLRNAGTTPVRLADSNQGLALNAYFVSGDKLTRGAILAEPVVLPVPRELPKGVLAPATTVQWEFTVSAKNRTRFSPHLALEFDPLQVFPDCRQRQRVWVIQN